MATRTLKLYIDYKSPYAYLAVAPAYRLADETGIVIDWLPYILDIPAYLGSATVDAQGRVIEQDRNAHQWRRVRYSYMDVRREANRAGLTIRGTQKIWDSSLAGIGLLHARRHGVLRAYNDEVFARFWKRELDIESVEALTTILDRAGAPGFAAYAGGKGRYDLERVQNEAEASGVFGVPSFLLENGDLYWGREHFGRVRELLETWRPGTEAGPVPRSGTGDWRGLRDGPILPEKMEDPMDGMTYGSEEAAMQAYLREGEKRAFALGNRGPIRFTQTGALHPEIVEAYWRCGFYVFEGVLRQEELADIERDLHDILERLPVERGSAVDRRGRPALALGCKAPTLQWARPLSDPWGGTDAANGRHPVKMHEPKAAEGLPREVVFLILGSLQFSDASLRVYGHPGLLGVAAAINGPDFAPFNEALWIKEPGKGASVAWHQDGVTHWNSPDWDEGSHGFNFMGQLYGCTAANGVWVVPGSHKLGKIDIAAAVAKAGTERLPEAVPIVCAPGDVAMTNRQALHGSFANTSKDWRVTVNFGFHRRKSVLGVTAGGIHNAAATYDESRIRERSRLIGYAIDARRQRFPDETPFAYQPHVQAGLAYRWDDSARRDIRDYNLLDLSI